MGFDMLMADLDGLAGCAAQPHGCFGRGADRRCGDDPITQHRWKPTFGADEGRGSFCAAARRHRAKAVKRNETLVEAMTHLDRDHYDLKSLTQNVLGEFGGVWPASVMGAEHSFFQSFSGRAFTAEVNSEPLDADD